MLGPPPRFYSLANLQQPTSTGTQTNGLRALSRLAEESMQQLDLNRNALAEQQMYNPTSTPFNNDRKVTSASKSPYVARNNTTRRMSYTPYPMLPQPPYFKTGLTGLDKADFSNGQLPQLKTPWPIEQFGEYCAEILNRDKHYWTDDETALMLELYEENRDHFNDSKTKKTKIWTVIASIVNKKFNTSVNAEQCSQKYRNLKAEYLKVADTTSEDGGAKKFGAHFKQMKRLLEAEEKNLPTVNPVECEEKQPHPANPNYDWVVRDEVIDSSDKYGNQQKNENVDDENKAMSDNTNDNCNDDTKTSDTMSDKTASANDQVSYHNLEPVKVPKQRVDSESSETSVSSLITNEIAGDDDDDDDEIQGQQNMSLEENSDSGENIQSPQDLRLYHRARQRFLEKQFFTHEDGDKAEDIEGDFEKKKRTKSEIFDHAQLACHKTRSHSKYSDELSVIFSEYFTSRQRELEIYELKQKENIKCMNKFIDIFRQALTEKQATQKC